MTRAPELDAPIRTATDLQVVWQRLMGEDGFGRRSLWLVFLDKHSRLRPPIMPIDDLPVLPDGRVVATLARAFTGLHSAGDFTSMALLLSRPGPPEMTDADRSWARALRDAFAALSPWPVHLATRGRVQVFAPDDLIAA